MTGGMEAKHDLAGGWSLDAHALGADGHASVGADFEKGAHAPDIIPPWAAWCWTQHGTFFFFGIIPGSLGSLTDFTMNLVSIVMSAERLDVLVGFVEF